MQKEDSPREDQARARETSISLQLNRCPFCHADVAVATDDWVACRQCLARHHDACWSEGGRCGTCGHDHVLTLVDPVAPGSPTLVRRAPSTAQLLAHGLEGVGRLGWALLRLPMALLRGAWAALRLANAWPRLTGVAVALALLLMLLLSAGSYTTQYVVEDRPVYTYHEPAPAVKTPRQRAREASARGEYGVARLELERLTRGSTITDATLWEELGWASLADGLPRSARAAYDRARELDPSQRRWGEAFAAAALGDKEGALAALGASLTVSDPTYRELWRAVLGGDRAGLSASTAADGTWQAALVRWGRGELDDAGLLEAAERWPHGTPSVAERRCEANAYVALGADLRGEREVALVHYARAVETSVFGYIEFVWASARLRALQGDGPSLGALAAWRPQQAPVAQPAPPAPRGVAPAREEWADGWGDDWQQPAPEPEGAQPR